ncbi:MAG: RDD family protein [Thermoplasmata archaeon]|nr:RDD family protein [Thermoplasmata archaeon]
MGLLDKAKKMKKEEGAKAPEPDVERETVAEPIAEEMRPPVAKKVRKKRPVKPAVKKRPAVRRPVPTARKVPMKKRVPKLKVTKPKREKKVVKPVGPAIEGLPEDLEFASIPSRLIAQVIDVVLLWVVLGVIGLVLFVGSDGESAACGVVFILGIVLPIGYFMMMEGKRDGQTIGKGIMGVKVIALDGRPLDPRRVAKSAIAKGLFFPMFLPVISVIDAALGVFFKNKDTLQRVTQEKGDLIVITVKKKKRVYGQAEEEEPVEEEEADTEEPWEAVEEEEADTEEPVEEEEAEIEEPKEAEAEETNEAETEETNEAETEEPKEAEAEEPKEEPEAKREK